MVPVTEQDLVLDLSSTTPDPVHQVMPIAPTIIFGRPRAPD